MATFTVSQGVELLKSKRFSDFTISCDGHDFAVHKNIIYQKSEFFALCIDSKFKEAKESAINLQEVDPLVVACVVLWIYTGMYNLKIATEVCPTLSKPLDEIKDQDVFENLTLNVLVYELAERLLLPDLQLFISGQLMKHLDDNKLFSPTLMKLPSSSSLLSTPTRLVVMMSYAPQSQHTASTTIVISKIGATPKEWRLLVDTRSMAGRSE